MPDRNDISQITTDTRIENANTFEGDTTIDSTQLKDSPETDFADPSELVDYHDPAETPDYMGDNPGSYITQVTRKTREVGKPIQVNGPGNYRRGQGYIAGYSFLETAGALAGIVLHDGADANAPIIDTIGLTANANSSAWYLPGGIQYQYGIYVEVVTGVFKGAIFIATEIEL